MEYLDYMLVKLAILSVIAFVIGFITAFGKR